MSCARTVKPPADRAADRAVWRAVPPALAATHHVAVSTAHRAITLLAHEHLITVTRGRRAITNSCLSALMKFRRSEGFCVVNPQGCRICRVAAVAWCIRPLTRRRSVRG